MKRNIGYWITGFADGESWFFARPLLRGYRKDRSIQISWHISLRDDDKETLELINNYFKNMGKLHSRTHPKIGNSQTTSNGQVTLDFWGAINCLRIVEHFEKFPLMSKKRYDYEVWKEIVKKVNDKYHLQSEESFIEVVRLCDKLRLVRLYPGKPAIEALKEVSGNNILYEDKVKNMI